MIKPQLVIGAVLVLCTLFQVATSQITVPFPEYPDSFSVGVEIVDLQESTTQAVYEVFDFPNQREYYQSTTSFGTFKIIKNYVTNEAYTIRDHTTCTVQDVRQLEGDENAKMRTVEELFLFGLDADVPAIYVPGFDFVRGIPANVFKRTGNSTVDGELVEMLDITYYFPRPDENWQYYHSDNFTLPLKVEVDTHDGDAYADATEYNFFGATLRVDDFDFQIDDRLDCGSLQTRELPTIPLQWSATIEITDFVANTTQTLTEHYDYGANVFMFEWHMNPSADYTQIFRLDKGATISLTRTENDHLCKISKLDGAGLDITNHTYHLKTSADLWRFGETYGEEYQGMTTVRGRDVHYWKSSPPIRTDRNGEIDVVSYFYFLAEPWSIGYVFPNGTAISEAQEVPVRVDIQGRRREPAGIWEPMHIVYDVINFLPWSGEKTHLFQTPDDLECEFQDSLSFSCLPGCGQNGVCQIDKCHCNPGYTGDFCQLLEIPVQTTPPSLASTSEVTNISCKGHTGAIIALVLFLIFFVIIATMACCVLWRLRRRLRIKGKSSASASPAKEDKEMHVVVDEDKNGETGDGNGEKKEDDEGKQVDLEEDSL